MCSRDIPADHVRRSVVLKFLEKYSWRRKKRAEPTVGDVIDRITELSTRASIFGAFPLYKGRFERNAMKIGEAIRIENNLPDYRAALRLPRDTPLGLEATAQFNAFNAWIRNDK